MARVCEHETCDRAAYSRGWCLKHYKRWWRNGSIYSVRRYSADFTLEDRLHNTGWDETDAGCWEWRGGRQPFGHGYVNYGGAGVLAHRLAYEIWVGPIPEGHVVRHKCDNPPCINPDHLETGTYADNNRDTSERGRGNNQKLTPSHRASIASRYKEGGVTQIQLAEEYGVSLTTINDAIHRKSRPTPWERQVREFRRVFGVSNKFSLDADCARGELAVSMVEEEVDELRQAYQSRDIVEIADALADIIYTTIGCAVDFGIDLNLVFREVHASNMRKVWPDGEVHYHPNGKVAKPAGWQPPNIKEVLGLD